MRVGLISFNGQARDAIGSLLADKLGFFLDRGADVRVFLQSGDRLHPALTGHCEVVDKVQASGPVWEFLAGADLVVVELSQGYDLLHFLPLLAGGKPRLLVDYHGVTPARWWPAAHRAALEGGLAQRGLVWCADFAVVHSRFMRAELVQATGFPDERVFQLDFPLAGSLHAGPAKRSLRAHLKLGTARVLLFVGRLAPNKGLPVLIEAVARLRELTPAVHAVIVGDATDIYAEEQRRCRDLSRRLGVAERVHFLGSVAGARLADCYRDSDVLVMPSLHEGFCIPVVEALACGLPVIAARATALPETVGDAGITFVAGDADDLARQVRRVLITRDTLPSFPGSAWERTAREALPLLLPVPLSPCTRGERVGVRGDDMPRENSAFLHTSCTPHPCPSPPCTGEREVSATLYDEVLPSFRPPLPFPCEGGEVGVGTRTRVAIVSFRFGAEIIGGAETSLRKIAHALQRHGRTVEVFTTCTRAESAWVNELPSGTTRQDDLLIHRFPIDAHDRERHLQSVRQIVEADGQVGPDVEKAYLEHSIHSAALVASLRERCDDFEAIIVGPYLFGLTWDIAQAFPDKTLLLPCFHKEPLARLQAWPHAYGAVGGVLFHSPEERELAQSELGINHPNSVEVGTYLASWPTPPDISLPIPGKRYVVYCGRYSRQKDLPRLIEYTARYQVERPDRFGFVCMGAGEVAIPREDWARDLGRVDEQTKRAVLRGAAALVQLSRQESLSLVVLEAWAEGTPVLVDLRCPVLAGQLSRCAGGSASADFAGFAKALDDLWNNPAAWQERGRQGQIYVQEQYGSEESFAQSVISAIEELHVPLHEQMRRRGLARAANSTRVRWGERFGRLVERVLDSAPRSVRSEVIVTPVRARTNVKVGAHTLLIPVRLHNSGSHAVCADGPARQVLLCKVGDDGRATRIQLPGLLLPGKVQTVAAMVAAPSQIGDYKMRLWVEREQGSSDMVPTAGNTLTVDATGAGGCLAPFLETAQQALVEAETQRCLPDDYSDVTEGWLANWKRRLKAKLLGNFKRGYVDVLSRQQSQVNRQVLVALQQLTECCATLDHAMRGIQERLDCMEKRVGAANAPKGNHESTKVRNHEKV